MNTRVVVWDEHGPGARIERGACNCDTGGCSNDDLDGLRLTANGEYYPLDGTPIMIDLPPGEHELTLSGEAAFHSEAATITITVLGSEDDSGTSTAGASTDGAESSGAGKCAVRPSGDAGEATFVCGLLLLLGVRRRR